MTKQSIKYKSQQSCLGTPQEKRFQGELQQSKVAFGPLYPRSVRRGVICKNHVHKKKGLKKVLESLAEKAGEERKRRAVKLKAKRFQFGVMNWDCCCCCCGIVQVGVVCRKGGEIGRNEKRVSEEWKALCRQK